jgi:hypothetical protein
MTPAVPMYGPESESQSAKVKTAAAGPSCVLCNAPIAFLRKMSDGLFCSGPHRKKYYEAIDLVILGRLKEQRRRYLDIGFLAPAQLAGLAEALWTPSGLRSDVQISASMIPWSTAKPGFVTATAQVHSLQTAPFLDVLGIVQHHRLHSLRPRPYLFRVQPQFAHHVRAISGAPVPSPAAAMLIRLQAFAPAYGQATLDAMDFARSVRCPLYRSYPLPAGLRTGEELARRFAESNTAAYLPIECGTNLNFIGSSAIPSFAARTTEFKLRTKGLARRSAAIRALALPGTPVCEPSAADFTPERRIPQPLWSPLATGVSRQDNLRIAMPSACRATSAGLDDLRETEDFARQPLLPRAALSVTASIELASGAHRPRPLRPVGPASVETELAAMRVPQPVDVPTVGANLHTGLNASALIAPPSRVPFATAKFASPEPESIVGPQAIIVPEMRAALSATIQGAAVSAVSICAPVAPGIAIASPEPVTTPQSILVPMLKLSTLEPGSAAIAPVFLQAVPNGHIRTPHVGIIAMGLRPRMPRLRAVPVADALIPEFENAPLQVPYWMRVPRALKIGLPLMGVAIIINLSVARTQATQQPANSSPSMFQNVIGDARRDFAGRAAIRLDDDFTSGLTSWTGDTNWQSSWKTREGEVRPGKLALFTPSIQLKDYQASFSGQIEKKSLSFVVRAADLQNYYAVKFVVVTPGLMPTVAIVRYRVVNGEEGPHVQTPLILPLSKDSVYHVQVQANGPAFTLQLNGQVVDTWSDEDLTQGGIGFFTAKGEQSRIQALRISHQNDTVGRMIASLR